MLCVRTDQAGCAFTSGGSVRSWPVYRAVLLDAERLQLRSGRGGWGAAFSSNSRSHGCGGGVETRGGGTKYEFVGVTGHIIGEHTASFHHRDTNIFHRVGKGTL